MRTLCLAYFLYIALGMGLVVTCSRQIAEPVTPSAVDSLALQHRLSHAVDSVDSVYVGCVWQDGMHICPDLKPPGPP